MGQRKISVQKLRQIEELAAKWGTIVARRALENSPTGSQLDLQDMEQIADAARAGLLQGTFDNLIQAQSQALGDKQSCPVCHLLCPVKYEDRPLIVKGGKIIFHEPVCYCSACRRNFFPPPG